MKLTVIKRAFFNNELLERGKVIDWPDGRKVPSWLKKPDEAAAVIAAEDAKPTNGDTKPRAARAAVEAKAKAAQGL